MTKSMQCVRQCLLLLLLQCLLFLCDDGEDFDSRFHFLVKLSRHQYYEIVIMH